METGRAAYGRLIKLSSSLSDNLSMKTHTRPSLLPAVVTALSLMLLAGSPTAIAQTGAPPEEETPYVLGKKALKDKDGATAISEFSKCVSAQPDDAECHWELGWSFFLEHEFEKARVEWLTVKRLAPQRTGLDKVLKTINRHLDILTRALALRTTSPTSLVSNQKRAGHTVKIRAVGDTMLGTNFPDDMLPRNDTSPLTQINPLIKGADITFANYEGTLCNGRHSRKCDGAIGGCYAFRSPRRFAGFLKDAGFDLISLANNHILDFGETCRDQTEKSLDEAGLLWSGRLGTVARFEHNTIKFSFIAFHAAQHTNSTLDIDLANQMIKAEKSLGRLVIVSFHGGAEGVEALHTPKTTQYFMGENRGDVRRFARASVDAGADLILGSGPHVVRGMEIYKDRLIAYSLGNFATYKAFNIWGFNGVGLILEAEIDTTGQFVAGKIIPTRQVEFGVPVLDKRMTAVDVIRLLSNEDFPKTGVVVAQDGGLGTPEKSHH